MSTSDQRPMILLKEDTLPFSLIRTLLILGGNLSPLIPSSQRSVLGLYLQGMYQIRQTMSVTQLDERTGLSSNYFLGSISPPKDIGCYLGKPVYIRSRVNTIEFWYCPQQKHKQIRAGTSIYTSTSNRTLFQLVAIPALETPGRYTQTQPRQFIMLPFSHLALAIRNEKGWSELIVEEIGEPLPLNTLALRVGTEEKAHCVCVDSDELRACECGSGYLVKPLYSVQTAYGEGWDI
ncbi:hypothetical protein BJ138DRAFT_1163545, partial [Hygrophoropsis aurantiaca]